MADTDFWKHRYQSKWEISAKREEEMKKELERIFNVTVSETGLGAGSTSFITGSAKQNGFTKGDADLHIDNTSIYIEVTGPLVTSVTPDKPLWFRPDKIQNAINNLPTHNTILAHHCPNANLWRFIYINNDFINKYQSGLYPIVNPKIGGVTETYIEIPANDQIIMNKQQFIELVRELIK